MKISTQFFCVKTTWETGHCGEAKWGQFGWRSFSTYLSAKQGKVSISKLYGHCEWPLTSGDYERLLARQRDAIPGRLPHQRSRCVHAKLMPASSPASRGKVSSNLQVVEALSKAMPACLLPYSGLLQYFVKYSWVHRKTTMKMEKSFFRLTKVWNIFDTMYVINFFHLKGISVASVPFPPSMKLAGVA